MRFTPHDYQETVLQAMMDKGQLALLLDPGMGKTAICLEDFRRRRDLMVAERALVVAPLRVCHSTWPTEAKKWSNFRNLRMHVCHGKGKDLVSTNAADIVVINPEGVKWLIDNAKLLFNFDVIYVDESTLFKNSQSSRSKAIYQLVHRMNGGIPYRFTLTGTPAPNGIENLFGQFKILDPEILGNTLKRFRRDHAFRPHPAGFGWEPTDGSMASVVKAITPHSIRLEAGDHLDMPGIQYIQRMITLPQKTMRLYRELAKELTIELKNGTVMAANAGVATSKCRQVANGAVYLTPDGLAATEETRQIEWLHTAKVDDLCDLYDELGSKPLLVGFEFKHDLSQIKLGIKDRFGFIPRYIGETTDAKDDALLIEQWNANELPMLLVNPAAASHGLNLQTGGHHLYWYSQIWDLEQYQQFNARLWRQGQPEGVFIHHAVAEKTVDTRAYNGRLKKDGTQMKLLYELKKS